MTLLNVPEHVAYKEESKVVGGAAKISAVGQFGISANMSKKNNAMQNASKFISDFSYLHADLLDMCTPSIERLLGI